MTIGVVLADDQAVVRAPGRAVVTGEFRAAGRSEHADDNEDIAMSAINVLAVMPVDELRGHGFDVGDVIDGGRVRLAVLADPAGNRISVAEQVG